MLQWFQRLMPRQNVFFPAFERHAAVMVKAAVALREMVAGGDTKVPLPTDPGSRARSRRHRPRSPARLAHDVHHAVRPVRH